MDEILRLLRENNEMLKLIISYISAKESPEYKMSEDMRALLINISANAYVDKMSTNKQG